jgi:poly(3-hydroxybutyrate) depolymerase
MRKLVTVLVAAAAFTAGLTGTATADTHQAQALDVVAAGGTAGPFRDLGTCNKVRKKYAQVYKVVKPCYKTEKGFFFVYG